MTRVMVITSGKGGVGKTTTAINLGAAIHKFGKDALIVDGNLSTANIGLYLNSPEVPITLNNVLAKKADIYDSVYEHESGIKIIPSSLSIKELNKLNANKLKTLKKDFLKVAENIIIDTSAGLGEEAISAMELADELIIVTNPEMPAIADALKTIKVAEKKKIKVKGVIVTRVRKDKIEMQPEEVKEMLELPVIGMIPEDMTIKKALKISHPVVHAYPKSKASRAYKEIAAYLLDVEYDSNKDKPGFLKRIFRRE